MIRNQPYEWQVRAWEAGLPKTDYQASITATLSQDGAAFGSINATNPSQIGSGLYRFSMLATEMDAEVLELLPVPADPLTVVVLPEPKVIRTSPQNISLVQLILDSAGTYGYNMEKLGNSQAAMDRLAGGAKSLTFGTIAATPAPTTTTFASDDVAHTTAGYFTQGVTRSIGFYDPAVPAPKVASYITAYSESGGQGLFTINQVAITLVAGWKFVISA